MVQAPENWADVEGVVSDVGPDPARPGWVVASLELRAADPVEGYPNMLAPSVGTSIRLAVPADEAADAELAAGSTVRARARLAAPRLALARPASLTVTPDCT